jgi:CxxC motif-containing protein
MMEGSMVRELTCIVCPKGCQLKVELDDNKKVVSVEGYTCKRGLEYAENEFTSPMRTLTTTAPIEGGGVVPVKTDKSIPKNLLFECMKVINLSRVPKDAKAGYIVIENVLGTGASVVTTRNTKI